MSSNPTLLDLIGQAFSTELPDLDSMDAYLDFILPKIRHLGEDLYEESHYVSKPWLEFQDNDHFKEVVLHFFNPEGEYLVSVNGDVESGRWRYLESSNKFLIEHKDTHLFDLAYMDRNFFILRKHGEQERFGKAKYFVLAHEGIAKHLEWKDVMALLYDSYRSNNRFYFTLTLIVLFVIATIMVLSVD
ncbi:MAG: hypothetical protein RL386_242 [Bacteroidota bacterium]|jgi:hypothetical protein